MKLYIAFIVLCFLGGYLPKLKKRWQYTLIIVAALALSLVYFFFNKTG